MRWYYQVYRQCTLTAKHKLRAEDVVIPEMTLNVISELVARVSSRLWTGSEHLDVLEGKSENSRTRDKKLQRQNEVTATWGVELG